MIPRISALTCLLVLSLPLAAQRAGVSAEGAPTDAGSEYARLMSTAEVALAQGEAARAAALFEAAAGSDHHSAAAELGMARAYLQEGEFRKAVSLASAVAVEHHESEARAFLAWLHYLGGQRQIAQRTLASLLEERPGDGAALAVLGRLRAHQGLDSDGGLEPPALGLDPHLQVRAGEPGAADLHPLANGVLVDQGRRVLTSATALSNAGGGRLWIRDGLGRLQEARVERVEDAVAVLVLPPDAAGQTRVAARAGRAFAGRPCFVLGFPAGSGGRAVWPVLTPGFLGLPEGQGHALTLPPDIPPGAEGGIVFDGGGQWVGLVLPARGEAGAGGGYRMLQASALVGPPLAGLEAPPSGGRRPASLSLDEIYERGMRVLVRVLVSPLSR